MRVLRISHSAVVSAWREREREIIAHGITTRLLTAQAWDEGGTLVHLEPGADDFVQGVRTFGTHPILFLYDPRPIWRALHEHWDVIDIHEEPYSLAAAEVLLMRAILRVRAPYILYSAQNIDKRYPPPFSWMERWILQAAGAVSVCNAEAGRIARRKGLGGYAANIPLGVDTSMFSPASREDASKDGCDVVHVGYVGRFTYHKGVDVLLDAARLQPRIRLSLVGAGPAQTHLAERARRLGIESRVRFVGSKSQEELPELYRTFDVVAVPSLPTRRWLEQFCRVAVESMAAGVPVVASDSGALPEVVGDAGILVAPNDPAALAEALVSAGGDPLVRARLVAIGLSRAQRFSWTNVGQQYVRLYRRLSAEASECPPVEVVVVAYGSPEMLRESLTPLAGHYRLIVVDNSSDAEIKALTIELKGTYIDPGANLGFAKAVNVGTQQLSDPDADVLLLNPDAVISADGVRRLSLHLHSRNQLASVGPAQSDGTGEQSKVSWPFPTPARSWLNAIGLGRIPSRRTFVIGSILLLKRSALNAIGPFDEQFFLYAEEADWAYRASRAGWQHEIAAEVTAFHHGAGTSSDPIRRDVLFHSSQELYLRKHYGAAGWSVARAAVIVGATIRSRVLRGDRGREARRRRDLYLAGPVRVADRFEHRR